MDSDATIREPESSSEQTVRESDAQGTVREAAAPASSSVNRPKFRDYDILQQLPTSGGESDIYVVGRGADQFILKLYRYKVEPKIEVIDKIMNLSKAHPHELVRVFEFGFDEATQRWFEIQEYVRGGSLRRIVDGISQGGEEWRNTVFLSLLREVSQSLKLLHENGILHLDLKPANVLARTLDPIDFVLIDFGISNTLAPELSKKFTAVRGTPMYQSPESWSGAVGVPSDWWSLGMLALEVAGGKHPFEGLSQQVVASLLMTKAVEISEEIAPDKRELLRGLLTRDTSKRWGYDQVSRWLGGERNIPVHFEKPADGSALAARLDKTPRPLAFMGEKHASIEALARAIAVDEVSWAKGRELLMRGNIRTWLEGNGEFERAVDVDSVVEGVQDPDEKLFRFVHRYGKPLPLLFMGKAITLGNLILFLGRSVRCEDLSSAEIAITEKTCGEGLSSLFDFYAQQGGLDRELDELRRALARIRGETHQVAFGYLDAIARVRRAVPPEQLVELRKAGVMNEIETAALRAAKDKNRNAPLIHALSHSDNPQVVSVLLGAGADANATSEDGLTALMLAVRNGGNPEIVRLLLKAGARAGATDADGETATVLAVRGDCDPETICALLGAGGEVGAEDAGDYLARNAGGGTEAYRRLKALSDFRTEEKSRWLIVGIGVAVAVIVGLSVFGAGVFSADRLNNLMFETIDPGSRTNKDLARLIKRGADVGARDRDGRTPLMNAAVSRPDLMPLLVENGADVNAAAQGARDRGKTALMFAAENNPDPEASRFLIEKGAEVDARDEDGRTPLRWAVMGGRPEVAALLIRHGADVDARDDRGATPLMGLAYAGEKVFTRTGDSVEKLSLLVESGADVDAVDEDGRTPLMTAVFGNGGSPGTAALLIERGANVNARDKSGRTPLMHAAALESESGPELVSLLIQKGAKVNARDENGGTPLMYAAARGSGSGKNDTSPEVVSLLLIKGASVNARDKRGKTALSLTKSNAVERLLRNAGGVR